MTAIGADPKARLALALLVIAAIGVGFSGIFVRLSGIGPTASAFWRMAFAFPVLLIWAVRVRGPARSAQTKRDRLGLAAAGLLYAAELAIWHLSLQSTSVANATVIANFYPALVTLYVWVLFGQRAKPVFLIGLAVAVAGMLLLSAGNFSVRGEGLGGDALSVLTSVFYAAYFVVVARLRAKHDTALIVVWTAAVAAIVLLPVALAAEESILPATIEGWGALVLLALICQAGSQSVIAYALAHLPAPLSAVTLMIQPLTAAIMAWIILGEALGTLQVLGGIVLLGGILVARRGSGR